MRVERVNVNVNACQCQSMTRSGLRTCHVAYSSCNVTKIHSIKISLKSATSQPIYTGPSYVHRQSGPQNHGPLRSCMVLCNSMFTPRFQGSRWQRRVRDTCPDDHRRVRSVVVRASSHRLRLWCVRKITRMTSCHGACAAAVTPHAVRVSHLLVGFRRRRSAPSPRHVSGATSHSSRFCNRS
jgi:hypothetical protein